MEEDRNQLLSFVIDNLYRITKAKQYDHVGKLICDLSESIPLCLRAYEILNRLNFGELNLTEDEQEYVISEVVDNVSFVLEESNTIVREEVLNDTWLETSDITFDYAKRYFYYLSKEKNWNDSSIEVLEKDSFKITQLLGNPQTKNQMHRKGLLIGDVQSGKTASYTAILNRAVDVGFNVIILLAGTTEILRCQTQGRIDYELVGSTKVALTKSESVGVGKLRKITEKVNSATSILKDYSKSVSMTQDSKIESGRTLLFVTKKNVSTLKAINAVLQSSNVQLMTNDIINGSILILDDEADNASVDTTKSDSNPTAINMEIRNLLHLFFRSSYLAVTATPFANIFIDDDLKAKFGRDLFPSDFIALLDRPHKYVGARELFGERALPEGKYSCTYEKLCIRRIYHFEMEDTYKYKHKKDVRVETFEGLPSSLKYSIRYFILVQKLMDYLPGIATKHRSMMINVSRFVDVQNNLYDVIKLWLTERLVPQIKKYGMMPNAADDIYSGEFHYLKMIWDKEGFEQISGIKWSDFSPALLSDIKRIRVALQNNSKKSKEPNVGLNYDNYKDGDRVIVVGGQCLSRGLTIEGLVVSYFYRNSATYDTLLQMGRWFGYRSEYLKYFRIWLSEQSLEWYKLISDACEDLRLQVKKMNEKKMSPSQFGLAVKYHIATGLIVTARNKMRNGKKSRRVPTDLCGQLIESPRLYYNATTNNENRNLIDGFISSISSHPLVKSGSGCCWQNIDKSEIASFVKKFQSAKLSIGFKVEELADYINMHSTPLWNVAISQNTIEDVQSGNYKGIERPYVKDKDNEIPIMKIYGHHVRIGSKSTTQLGLSDEEIEAIKEKVGIIEWKANSSLSSYYLTNPGGFKRNSVLILYPLRLYEKDDNTDSPKKYYSESKDLIVWGVGLGFAGDKNAEKDAQCFEYIINPVAQDIDAEWNFNSPEEDDIQDEKD